VSRETGTFAGKDGTAIFWRRWLPERPVCTAVLVPGAAEHSGRYHHVGHFFAERQVGVHALDHRGYGRSGGRRGHVERFADYLDDLRTYVGIESERAGRLPVMIGHSMGGLIALSYALAHPGTIAGLVLSSPSLGLTGWQRRFRPMLEPVLRLLPRRLAVPARIDPRRVSRRRWTWTAYAADPLITRAATPGWMREFLGQLRRVEESVPGLAVPSLWLQAQADSLVDPHATARLFERVRSAEKEFRWYPDRHHEIFNDPGREEVFTDILSWLARCGLYPGPVAGSSGNSDG
jgi:acylglycerol lipase